MGNAEVVMLQKEITELLKQANKKNNPLRMRMELMKKVTEANERLKKLKDIK